LQITEPDQQFVFEEVEEEPVASLLRGFSAPVRLQANYTIEQLAFLMAHDSDGFNRWNAGQMMAGKLINALLEVSDLRFPDVLGTAFSRVIEGAIANPDADRAGVAQLLTLPPLASLIEQSEQADVDRLHEVREFLLDQLAEQFEDKFAALLQQLPATEDYVADAQSIGNRALRNLCLTFLARGGDDKWVTTVQQQFETANNMTDQSTALRILVHGKSPRAQSLAESALDAFYQQWRHEPLVVDQWLSVQATSPTAGALEQVKKLMQHEAFQIRNPNKVRALVGAFCGQNHINFHAIDGGGYEFLADRVVELDQLNPQIASRLLTPLTRWRKFDPARQALMQAQLQRIKALDGLSKDVFEVVEKSTL
jgi:aminopeptidase N